MGSFEGVGVKALGRWGHNTLELEGILQASSGPHKSNGSSMPRQWLVSGCFTGSLLCSMVSGSLSPVKAPLSCKSWLRVRTCYVLRPPRASRDGTLFLVSKRRGEWM